MERILSAESAYKVYRQAIHSANPPCIPYIGVYLLDLIYIEDGNPDTIDGLINFSKRHLVTKVIQDVGRRGDISVLSSTALTLTLPLIRSNTSRVKITI